MTNSPSRALLHLFTDNLGWLVGSIMLAVIVWFAAVNQQNPVEQQRFRDTIPVQVLKDESLLIVNQPSAVQVVVRAPRNVWDVLQANDITVSADLRGKPAGTYTVPLVAAMSPVRQGAVSDVLPSQVTVTLAKSSERSFDIAVTYLSDPPVGYMVASRKTSEPSAKVSGSEDQVNRVAAVVARVALAEQSKPITRAITLQAVDGAGDSVSGVTITPGQVTAVIDIEPRPDVTVLKVAPALNYASMPQGYNLKESKSAPETVAVRGDSVTIGAMNGTVNTELIDLTNKTASFTQTVKLALPDGVSLTDPVNVVVSVTIDPVTVTRTFANIPVQPQGLDSNDFSIVVKPDTVSVSVTGPVALVNSVQASDISVVAPLADLGGGTFPITLQASITSHAGLSSANLSIQSPQVQVTILALHPTPTPTVTPTPRPTPTPLATASATP